MASRGTSVAYYAKPIAQAQATLAINAGGLDEVLRHFRAA
jgi:hypothetical protein